MPRPSASPAAPARPFAGPLASLQPQTAEVVLPVPGLRLARARLRPVIKALCQHPRHTARQGTVLSDGTLTGTAGYGSRDGPRPRTLDPAAAPPPADKRGGRAWARWTGQPPRFPSVPSPAGPHRCSGRPRPPSPPAGAPFRAWLSRRHGTVGQPAGLGSTPSALKRHRRAKIMQYYRIHGITAAISGLSVDVRAGRKTDRETCGSARTLRRYARAAARQGPARQAGPGNHEASRREHAFRRLASGAGRPLGGDAGAFTIPPARPAHAGRLPAPRRRYSPRS